ncbi:FAD/NAD(P)-binding protein [Demequina aurantiaca]|uniref:FAD/NAD(P)-binding protein n=1 Tax=Demequina aurantiaca TaxID=676200 RepID=UPI003D3441D8
MSENPRGGAMDLVVVGGGPRALYALADLDEELARSAPEAQARPFRVTILETGRLGAGAVWEPGQPAHLMMNVDSRIVDATCPSVPLTFQQWQGSGGEVFPSRAQVGRYLAWSFERLRESARLEVIHRPVRATAVRREGLSWVCETVDAAGKGAASERSPRVMLATGHTGGPGIDHAAVADASRGPCPGAPVVVRGASLTAFDVVMDLTAGRGGSWVADATVDWGLRYVPGGSEPSSITMLSRSGEPMLPKPVSLPAAVVAAVRDRTSAWSSESNPDDEWWDVLAAGAEAAALASGTRVTREELWARLDGVLADGPDARWARDVRRALGDVDSDCAWWWGRAWAAGYADVVRSLERAPRDPALWSRWRARAATLERWAFGPPLVTHRRLLALRESGILRVVRGSSPAQMESGVEVIDAFTRGPGIRDAVRGKGGTAPEEGREPWEGLLADGHVSVRPGERGALTASDGTCVGPGGDLSVGLAALGRPTEDPVIGHDSLQRRLHGDSSRWARAVATTWLADRGVESAQLTKVGTDD